MVEQWKAVAEFKGMYEVSNLGRVRSLDHKVRSRWGCLRTVRGQVLNLQLYGRYLSVGLSKNSRLRYIRVHRLVATAFLENPENKPEVHHKKNPKTNNRVSNLEWLTKAEHDVVTMALSQHPKGSKNSCAKLTETQVIEMHQLRAQGWLLRELAALFGTCAANVSNVLAGRRWKHVPVAGTKKPVQSVRLAERKAA
jgi:hypothetical protein